MTTGPIIHVGWASASCTVTPDKSVRSLKGPPLAVRISFETSDFFSPINACHIAECSESTGRSWSSFARARTKSPPATSDSLLARATRLSASSAASVGANPMEPVIPLRTTSQEIAATSLDAFGPSTTSTPGSAARMTSPFLATPTTLTLNFLA